MFGFSNLSDEKYDNGLGDWVLTKQQEVSMVQDTLRIVKQITFCVIVCVFNLSDEEIEEAIVSLDDFLVKYLISKNLFQK